jgi:transposase
MARPLVSDELWELIEPLIPKMPRRDRFPGRKRINDRKVLTGILFMLRTGIPWEYLPQERGCGSGVTCWRRLREWQQAGVLAAAARALAGEAAEGRADRLVAGGDRQIARAGVWGGPRIPLARSAASFVAGTSRRRSLGRRATTAPGSDEKLGRRAHDRLAAPVPTAAHPLRTPR